MDEARLILYYDNWQHFEQETRESMKYLEVSQEVLKLWVPAIEKTIANHRTANREAHDYASYKCPLCNIGRDYLRNKPRLSSDICLVCPWILIEEAEESYQYCPCQSIELCVANDTFDYFDNNQSIRRLEIWLTVVKEKLNSVSERLNP